MYDVSTPHDRGRHGLTGQLVHDPLCPLVQPLHPQFLLLGLLLALLIHDEVVRDDTRQTVEGGHGVDVLGSAFTLPHIILQAEPGQGGLQGVARC